MPYLTALSLQNANAVTDAGCCAIARVAPLRTLNLKNCPAMSDLGLDALRPLKRLSHLRLQASSAPGLRCLCLALPKVPTRQSLLLCSAHCLTTARPPRCSRRSREAIPEQATRRTCE